MAQFAGPGLDGTYVYCDSQTPSSSNNLAVNTFDPADLSMSQINTIEPSDVKSFETNFGDENSCGNFNLQGIHQNFNLGNEPSQNSCIDESYHMSSNMSSYDCDMFAMHYCCPDSTSSINFHSADASGVTNLNDDFPGATCCKSPVPGCSTGKIFYSFVNDNVKVEKDSNIIVTKIKQRKTANRKAAVLSRRRKSTQTDETLLMLNKIRKENEVLYDQVQMLQYEAFKIHTIMSNCTKSNVSKCNEVELPSISLETQSDDYNQSPFDYSD